jgi:XTP/dITP diphosphohydrolase
MLMKVLIASSNPGKLRDFVGAAALYDVQPELIPGFEQLPPAVEDGASFAENARKKSEHYSRYLPGELVLADDSGLAVDALGGAPGVHSARYAALRRQRPDAAGSSSWHTSRLPLRAAEAGASSGDEANNACLLRELATVSDERRQARFVCVLSVARDGIELASFRGEAHGVLLRQPRGNNGFGYDPLFFFPPLSKTFAELTPEQKAAVSHRGQALRAFLNWCRQRCSP